MPYVYMLEIDKLMCSLFNNKGLVDIGSPVCHMYLLIPKRNVNILFCILLFAQLNLPLTCIISDPLPSRCHSSIF